ncbi:MAG: nitrogen regulation protein NR(II) [Dongiaceae bacterium]
MIGSRPFRDEALDAQRTRILAAAIVVLAAGAFLLGWYLDLPVLGLLGVLVLSAVLLYGAVRLGRAEIARARAEERFHGVFRSGIGVAVWDMEGDIRDANDAFLAMIGYERDELRAGRLNWRDLAPPSHSGASAAADHAIPRPSGTAPQEQGCTRKDGACLLLSVWSAPLASDPGQNVSVVLDATQQRETEGQLRREQDLQALGRMMGAAAHDLNNLLMVTMGNGEMLAAKLAGDARLLEMAELIGKSAKRSAGLTGRLLALARRHPLRPQAVDINRLLASLEDRLRSALGRNIRIELIRDAGLWPATADATALEAAFLNLALDARDAMPDGGRLTITTANLRIGAAEAERYAQLQPGQYVTISLAGLSPAHAGSIFAAEDGGPGLGLARGLLKPSGGQISIDGTFDEGTTVTMYLPHALGTPPADRSE